MSNTKTEDREELVATGSDALRDQALRRIKKRRDFKAHLFVYSLFNLALWTIWAIIGISSGSWWPWPIFPTFFWGIGLVMNAWDVYLRRPISDTELQHEMDRLRPAH